MALIPLVKPTRAGARISSKVSQSLKMSPFNNRTPASPMRRCGATAPRARWGGYCGWRGALDANGLFREVSGCITHQELVRGLRAVVERGNDDWDKPRR
jgi:hypothetical protein